MKMEENQAGFDINNLPFDDVQESKDYAAVKAGSYRLKVEEIKQEMDNKNRPVINVRHSIVGEAETVSPGEVGGIFNTLYLHTPKAFGFLRRFVEAHGSTWDDFKTNRDVSQFVGAEADAHVQLQTKDKDGNDLASPKNRIGKYLVEKVTQ